MIVLAVAACLARPVAFAADTPAGSPTGTTALITTGNVSFRQARYSDAIAAYQKALTAATIVSDEHAQGEALNGMGNAYAVLCDWQNSLGSFRKALEIAEKYRDPVRQSITLSNLGLLQSLQHSSHYAIEYYRLAVKKAQASRDRQAVRTAYTNMGREYVAQGRYKEAFAYLQGALDLRQGPDTYGDAWTYDGLGAMYAALNEYDLSDTNYNKALSIRVGLSDIQGQSVSLTNLGNNASSRGQYQDAIDFYKRAQSLESGIGDRRAEANTAAGIARALVAVSKYADAVGQYNRSVDIRAAIGDKAGLAEALNGLGNAYGDIGDNERASQTYQKALLIAKEIGDDLGQSDTLNNLGLLELNQSRFATAIPYFQQARSPIAAAVDVRGQANVLNNLGRAHLALKQYDAAQAEFDQALKMRLSAEDDYGLSWSLDSLGLLAKALGNYDKAQGYFRQALLERRKLQDHEGEAASLANLMALFQAQKAPAVAIFYGKEAVNALQDIRARLETLDAQARKAYVGSHRDVYRSLADTLIAEGRLDEAQQIIGMLKADEFHDYVSRDSIQAASTQKAAFSADEAKMDRDYATSGNEVAAVGRKRFELRAKYNTDVLSHASADTLALDLANIHDLDSKLADADSTFGSYFVKVKTQLASKEKATGLPSLQLIRSFHSQLRRFPVTTAAIYTVVSADTLRVIVVTPETQIAEEYPISRTDLRQKVLALQQALQNPTVDPRPLAAELYHIVFCQNSAGVDTVARDLADAGITTVMWSLDDVLRYIPMAALYDGTHYLVDKYDQSIFNPNSLVALDHEVSKSWTGLGLGVSLAHKVTSDQANGQDVDFPALPGVQTELHGIFKAPGSDGGVLDGKVLIDNSFTRRSMSDSLETGQFKLVHIASHFQFSPGDQSASYLLLGDGSTLSMEDFSNLQSVLGNIELMTLSACNTATGDRTGDGAEVEGFADKAQGEGADAVLATLWAVADSSTSALMREFYRVRESGADLGMTKAHALRSAQMNLLHDTVKFAPDAVQRGIGSTAARNDDATKTQFKPDRAAPFEHPYYWAPFVLVGNWK